MKAFKILLRAVMCMAVLAAVGEGSLSGATVVHAAESASGETAADVAKRITPGTNEEPDTAFRKLAEGRPYLVKDDVKLLEGFALIFDAADSDHDGRLSLTEFKTAWKAYVASDKSNRG